MLKILFIDDEQLIRSIGKMTLEKAGFEVVLAKSAEEGMAFFTSEVFDLVITDLTLPGQEGFSNVLQMKEIRKNQPVMVVSGGDLGSQDFLLKQEKAGITHTLAKPFDLSDLVKHAEECIHGKAA